MSSSDVYIMVSSQPLSLGTVLKNAQTSYNRIREIQQKEVPYPWIIDDIIRIASQALNSIHESIRIHKERQYVFSNEEKLLAFELIVKLEKIKDCFPSKITRYFIYFFCCCGEYERSSYAYNSFVQPEYHTFSERQQLF